MIAAIYARKSTEQTGMNDEEKSVTRQIEHARAYALKKGWTVSEDHIYADDGISGAEFGDRRPGFLRLMAAIKPSAPFQVLIMSEESRLGREQTRTQYALLEIVEAGVRVFFYLDDQERKMDTATDKLISMIKNFGGEFERERTSQRVHDRLLQKARALHVVGCKVYGYDNVDVLGPDGKRQHVLRQINPIERDVLLRIFELYAADGIGTHAIAKILNADGIPPPRGHRRGWAGSCIRAILYRPLYRGTVVWNKTKAINRGGTKTSTRRPPSEWESVDAPALRIISPELWARVQAKLTHAGSLYTRRPNGQLVNRPSGADLRSTYLRSGLAQCAVCGGSIVCQLRRRCEGKNVYMCAYHHGRGKAVCVNDLRMKQDVMDRAVLDALHRVLDTRLLEAAVLLAGQTLRANPIPDERMGLEQQLALIETRLKHLVDAIATGKATEAVFTELQHTEATKTKLIARIRKMEQLSSLASMEGQSLTHMLADRVADVRGMLGRHIPQTRQLLRKLIPGRIVCAPFDDGRGRGYALSAVGTYAGLLGGKLMVNYNGGEGGI